MYRSIVMALAAMLAVGCGESKPPERTVFDPQLEAVKKARQTEQKVLDAAQQRGDAVQRQESGEK